MYDKLDKQVNNDVIPRLEAVEKQQREYNIKQEALKNDVQSVSLAQQDLKNTVERVGNDQKSMLDKQEKTLDKLFDHLLHKDKVQTETEAETDRMKVQTEGQVSIAKTQNEGSFKLAQLSFKEKLIVSLLGAGGVLGFVQTGLLIYRELNT